MERGRDGVCPCPITLCCQEDIQRCFSKCLWKCTSHLLILMLLCTIGFLMHYHYQNLHVWAGSQRVSLLLFCEEHCLVSVKNTAKSSCVQDTTNISRQQEDLEQSL